MHLELIQLADEYPKIIKVSSSNNKGYYYLELEHLLVQIRTGMKKLSYFDFKGRNLEEINSAEEFQSYLVEKNIKESLILEFMEKLLLIKGFDEIKGIVSYDKRLNKGKVV